MANKFASFNLDDPVSGYLIARRDSDASPNFYGYVRPDGSWYILRETLSAGNDTYEYVKGGSDFDTNWTNRVGLTYDFYHNVFDSP